MEIKVIKINLPGEKEFELLMRESLGGYTVSELIEKDPIKFKMMLDQLPISDFCVTNPLIGIVPNLLTPKHRTDNSHNTWQS